MHHDNFEPLDRKIRSAECLLMFFADETCDISLDWTLFLLVSGENNDGNRDFLMIKMDSIVISCLL